MNQPTEESQEKRGCSRSSTRRFLSNHLTPEDNKSQKKINTTLLNVYVRNFLRAEGSTREFLSNVSALLEKIITTENELTKLSEEDLNKKISELREAFDIVLGEE